MPLRVHTAIALCLAALACGGGGSTGPAPVASVMVDLAQSLIAVGATTTATATVKDAGGNVLTGRAITWSSNDPNVATVSAAGVVSAVSSGTAVISASTEGRSGTATLTVGSPVGSVTVTLASSTIAVGASTQATATTTDAGGSVLTGRSVTWSSDNTAVATVNTSGVVTGVAAGTATITATSESKSGSAAITVLSPLGFGTSAEKIRIVDIGNSFTPTFSGPGSGATFVSRATSVATVDAQGTITGVGEGQVWVVTTAPGWLADSVYVIVPRNSTGPVLRTDLTTFKVKPGTTMVINIVLDTRSTPIGGTEFSVAFTTLPRQFQSANYLPIGSPAPQVSSLQVGLLRVSLASGSPLSGALSMVQLTLTTTSSNSSGFVTLTLLDLVSPTGADLLPVSTSTRIPIIVHD